MKTLRVEGLNAGYGDTTVIRNVDLVVPGGKTVALLGANGAGKSTLLKTVAGLVPPLSGRIWLGDARIDELPAHSRAERGLCLIPEGHAIFRGLSVRDNIAMYCGGRAVRQVVDRVVTAFPVLGRRLTQEAGTLSGGEQQMLALSRALVGDAKIILADELSMGLAPVIVDEIFEVVKSFRAEGRSLLIVEQFVARALAVSDYVYILHKGRVVFVGEPHQCEDERVFEQYVGSMA
jgi:branched-chain amino acid transport system ATP-binding protein